MNILDVLGEKVTSYSFACLERDDQPPELDDPALRKLIDNREKIKKYYDGCNLNNIETLDNFIDYLYLNKFSNCCSKNLKSLKQKDEESLTNILLFIQDKFKNFSSTKSLIKYIKTQWKEFWNIDNDTILFKAIDLIFKYSGQCYENILDLAKNHPELIIENFWAYRKVVIKYEDICFELLDKKNFDRFISIHWDFSKYFNMISFFKNRLKYEAKVHELLEYIAHYLDCFFKKINEDDLLISKNMDSYLQILQILRNIKDVSIRIYKKNILRSENFERKYLKKHGYKRSILIPGDIFKPFVDKDVSMIMKIIYLTHNKINKDTYQSRFTIVIPKKGQDFPEEISFHHKQSEFGLPDPFFVGGVLCLLSKQNIEDFMKTLKYMLSFICKYYKLDSDKSEIEAYFEDLLALYKNLFDAHSDNNEHLNKGYLYATITYEVIFLEKLLRTLWEGNDPKSNETFKNITLGDLLNPKNKIIVDLLGIENVEALSFYLLINENKSGLDYRNKIIHMDIARQDIIIQPTLFMIMELLIGVINQLYLKKNNKI